MGRKPRQEHIKDYMVNPRTAFLFSTPAEYRECFGEMSGKYLKPAIKGTRLGKKTFRVVVHLPNKHHNDMDNYLAKMKGNWIDRTFLDANAPIPASRIRWDSPSNPGVHLIMHTERGKRVEFFLTQTSSNPKGAVVNGQISFPTMMRNKHTYKNGKSVWRRSEKLMSCRVELGFFGVSASVKGKYSLKLGKPIVRCPPGLTKKGHAPAQFTKEWEPTDDKAGAVKVANAEENMAEDNIRAFYEAQNMDYDNLLEIQDVEIMDSETEQQAIERQYYNPSEAMVGNETLDGYTPSESTTVDLTSNQPTANYGAEGETATYSPSDEPDMVSSSSFEDPTNANFSAEGTRTFIVSSVDYETDGVKDGLMGEEIDADELDLPQDFTFTLDEHDTADLEGSTDMQEIADLLVDNISDETGWLVQGFYFQEKMPDGTLVDLDAETSLNGYAPLDSLEEGAPIGHGVNQYFGSAEGTEEALLDESTTDIGIEEGTSLEGFSGVDSVVVEAPLGHGVTQWYAETDGPQPPEPAGITGQDGPSADPTNAHMKAEFSKSKGRNYARDSKGRIITHDAQGYNDKMDESMGMRHRGRKSQSMKSRRDEASAMDKRGRRGRKYDDVMAMDASGTIVDWRDSKGQFKGGSSAHDSKGRFLTTKHADTAGYLQDGSLSMEGYTPLESVEVDRTSFQPTQNYGAEYEGEGFETFKTGAYFGTGWMVGVALLTAATVASLGLVGKIMDK